MEETSCDSSAELGSQSIPESNNDMDESKKNLKNKELKIYEERQISNKSVENNKGGQKQGSCYANPKDSNSDDDASGNDDNDSHFEDEDDDNDNDNDKDEEDTWLFDQNNDQNGYNNQYTETINGLLFSSKFDSGNLVKVVHNEEEDYQFRCWIGRDGMGTKYECPYATWFYFSVEGANNTLSNGSNTNLRRLSSENKNKIIKTSSKDNGKDKSSTKKMLKGRAIEIVLMNMNVHKNLFRDDMRPVYKVVHVNEKKTKKERQNMKADMNNKHGKEEIKQESFSYNVGQDTNQPNIEYTLDDYETEYNDHWKRLPSPVKCKYTHNGKRCKISFRYRFESNNERVYFAFTYPFSYIQTQNLLNTLINKYTMDQSYSLSPPNTLILTSTPLLPSINGGGNESKTCKDDNANDKDKKNECCNSDVNCNSKERREDDKQNMSDKTNIGKEIYFHRDIVTQTLDGNNIDILTISSKEGMLKRKEVLVHANPIYRDKIPFYSSSSAPSSLSSLSTSVSSRKSLSNPSEQEHKDRPNLFHSYKKVILITSRVHPGETPASFVFNGVLKFLLNPNDIRAKQLRSQFVFKLIPMLNPDGVSRGYYRHDSIGQNLNRFYLPESLDPEKHPSIAVSVAVCHFYTNVYPELQKHENIDAQIYNRNGEEVVAVSLSENNRERKTQTELGLNIGFGRKEKIVEKNSYQYQSQLLVYIDLHAHAARRGCFFYGNQLPNLREQTLNQLYVKLISLNSIYVDYCPSLFAAKMMSTKDKLNPELSKEGAGRVAIYTQFNIRHCYTLECNYNEGTVTNPKPAVIEPPYLSPIFCGLPLHCSRKISIVDSSTTGTEGGISNINNEKMEEKQVQDTRQKQSDSEGSNLQTLKYFVKGAENQPFQWRHPPASPPAIARTGSIKYGPEAFEDVGKGILIALLDMAGTNALSRIQGFIPTKKYPSKNEYRKALNLELSKDRTEHVSIPTMHIIIGSEDSPSSLTSFSSTSNSTGNRKNSLNIRDNSAYSAKEERSVKQKRKAKKIEATRSSMTDRKLSTSTSLSSITSEDYQENIWTKGTQNTFGLLNEVELLSKQKWTIGSKSQLAIVDEHGNKNIAPSIEEMKYIIVEKLLSSDKAKELYSGQNINEKLTTSMEVNFESNEKKEEFVNQSDDQRYPEYDYWGNHDPLDSFEFTPPPFVFYSDDSCSSLMVERMILKDNENFNDDGGSKEGKQIKAYNHATKNYVELDPRNFTFFYPLLSPKEMKKYNAEIRALNAKNKGPLMRRKQQQNRRNSNRIQQVNEGNEQATARRISISAKDSNKTQDEIMMYKLDPDEIIDSSIPLYNENNSSDNIFVTTSTKNSNSCRNNSWETYPYDISHHYQVQDRGNSSGNTIRKFSLENTSLENFAGDDLLQPKIEENQSELQDYEEHSNNNIGEYGKETTIDSATTKKLNNLDLQKSGVFDDEIDKTTKTGLNQQDTKKFQQHIADLKKSRELYDVSSSKRLLSTFKANKEILENQKVSNNTPILVCTSSKTFIRPSLGSGAKKSSSFVLPRATPASLSLTEVPRKRSSATVNNYFENDHCHISNQKILVEENSQYLIMKQNLSKLGNISSRKNSTGPPKFQQRKDSKASIAASHFLPSVKTKSLRERKLQNQNIM